MKSQINRKGRTFPKLMIHDDGINVTVIIATHLVGLDKYSGTTIYSSNTNLYPLGECRIWADVFEDFNGTITITN